MNKNIIVYNIFIYLSLNKGLFNVYTIKLIKHKNDRPHGIVKNIVGIIISMLFSLSVKLLFNDKVLL